jgi:hypothetical protein
MPCVRALVRWMMVLPLKSTAVTEIPIPSSGGVRESLATLSPRRIIVPENSGFFLSAALNLTAPIAGFPAVGMSRLRSSMIQG